MAGVVANGSVEARCGKWCLRRAMKPAADGSARWVRFEWTLYLTTWTTDGTRIYYFYQEDLPPGIQNVIAQLGAKP